MKRLILIILLIVVGCKVKANCATGFVSDPIVDSITVDIAGNVTICWQAVVDPDISHYAIYMYNPVTGANDSIDQVAAPGTCFTLPAALNNSDFETVELSVVALDNCPTPNSSTSGVNYHNTILLENTVDICSASIDLNWTPYDDFNSGLNVLYHVYVSVNAGPFVFAGNTNSTNYTFSGIVQGATYDFYVRAYENNGAGPISSSSNDIQINTINFLKDPQFNYLYTATVISPNEINVQFYVDTSADISHYNIKRRASLSDAYSIISSIPAYAGMNPLITYYDYDVDANATFYYYEVETINSCGDLKLTSNIGKTIWLFAEADEVAEENTITFTKYENWAGGVNEYEVYRSVGGVWDILPVANITSTADTTVFVDNIITETRGDGEFCYKVVAKELTFPHVGGLPEAESVSNESCVVHQPLIYVPNAFAPQSIYNPLFKPVLTFSDPTGYVFQVYNKWGQKIFETQNLDGAWNGYFENSGKRCQSDSYVYLIRFIAADGEEYKKTGVVTLLW